MKNIKNKLICISEYFVTVSIYFYIVLITQVRLLIDAATKYFN